MIIIVNLQCGGKRGDARFNKRLPFLREKFAPFEVWKLDTIGNLPNFLRAAYEKGENCFAIAGGDGTANILLNAILSTFFEKDLKNIKLGFIGIGSSNDLHKPKNSQTPSIKMDFQTAALRDILCLEYEQDGQINRKYALLNMSMGITAKANSSFNNPGLILRILKRISSPLAILYAAISTILTYKNMPIEINVKQKTLLVNLSNLGVIKSPYFAGNFHYDTPLQLNDGRYYLHICHDMNFIKILKLLKTLSKGKFAGTKNAFSYDLLEHDKIIISSKIPFCVEFDGEIIERIFSITCSLKSKYIYCCER